MERIAKTGEEIVVVVESAFTTDLCDGLIGIGQELDCAAQAHFG